MNGKGEKKFAWLSAILMIISMGTLYLAHSHFEFLMDSDDGWYSTNLVTGERIHSLADIAESQVWHYFHWGGRSMGHAIVQLTLWAGETAADVLNVLFTLLLALIICRIAGGRTPLTLFLSLSMIVGLTAGWKSAMLWQAGAGNYLYLSVFIFLYLLCFFRDLRESKKLPFAEAFMIPLGLIAGWSNENMGPTVWILSLIILIWHVREKRKLPFWMAAGNIACLAGSVMLIAAPGNYVRGNVAEESYGLLWRVFLRCYAECKGVLIYLFPALLTAGFIWVIGKRFLRIPVGRERALLFVGALLSWGALFLSPVTADRAFFGTTLFLIAFSLSYLREILDRKEDLAGTVFAMGGLIWLRGMYLFGEYICTVWGWIK